MHGRFAAMLALATSLLLVAFPAAAQPTPLRVAVFSQRGFPAYGIGALPNPARIVADLRAAGIDAALLDTDALAQIDARRFAAVILPYGNTFPEEAFAALRRFHQAGGSLVTTGIPFTHPTARVGAERWDPSPGWGHSVQVVPEPRLRPGTFALEVHGDPDRWTGATSARFSVQPGDTLVVSAQVRAVASARTTDANPDRQDRLFVRFFDADGRFLQQDGPSLATAESVWRAVSGTVTAPQRAAAADLSVQVRRPGYGYWLTRFTMTRNGAAVTIPNADLARRGTTFADLGHDGDRALFGSQGIGIGGFAGPGSGDPAPSIVAPGDPLRLKGVIAEVARPNPPPQWLDPRSLPAGVRVVPAVGSASRPLVALVIHEKGPFAGAVDAWTFRANAGDTEEYDTRQTLTRATVAALARRGVLSGSQRRTALTKLGALPRPAIYADLTLPTVPRRYTTFQPKMPPPARHLTTADVRKLSADDRLLLISLQGIVNRTQPRIYLIFDDDDRRWLDELQRQGVTDAPIVVDDPFSLLTLFRSAYRGAVVCDPRIYLSPCVAVALAGTDDLVIARTPTLAARHNLPVRVDLRGRFADDPAALRYVRTQLASRLDPYLTCSLDPAVFHEGGLDSLIAARGSVFWITGPRAQELPGADQAGEMEEVRALLAQMPLGAVVRGFWWHGDGIGLQEDAGVALGSRFGKVTLVSDLITNLSVHSGAPSEKLTQRPRPAPPALDPGKVYVAFTMSDGDNLCTWRGYFRRYFEDPARGTIPVGWGMGPALLDLAPTWMRWYYENATENDEFVCDVSGVAYMYPPSWGTALKDRDAAFRFFYGRTAEYMARTDMKTVRLMDVRADDIARVGPLLPGIDYLIPDYGHAGGTDYADLTYSLPGGQAIFRAATSGSGPAHFAEQIRARAGKDRPAFLNAFVWNWGSSLSDLKRTMELLGPDYVAVTPSQLNALYRSRQGASPRP
jgi:hypothetical protein